MDPLTGALRDLGFLAVSVLGFGETATLRQKCSVVSALSIRGGASTGDTSILCTSGAGTVVQGTILEIAGVSGAYTVQETSQAANGRITLSLDHPLEGAASDGAAVTFSQAYGEWSYPAMDGSGQAEVDKEIVAGRRIRVLACQDGKPAPREHDDELDGQPVTGVHTTGNPPTRYRVTVTAP